MRKENTHNQHKHTIIINHNMYIYIHKKYTHMHDIHWCSVYDISHNACK